MRLEDSECIKLINWCNDHLHSYPELDLLYHVPNGVSMTIGYARLFKRLGMRAGVSDYCLPVARGYYHALYLEMKAGNGKLSPAQKRWIDSMRKEGNLALVACGFEAGRDALIEYLCLPKSSQSQNTLAISQKVLA